MENAVSSSFCVEKISDSTFNETFEEAVPELELSVQMSGGEF